MKKVLIIDDDVDFSESLATLLKHSGHTVLQAHDGDEGVTVATREKPDVILCDVMMKERTEGFFAIQRLRRTPGVEDTPILVISSVYQAVPNFQVPPEKSWLAHNAFMQKPVDPDALLRMIEEAV
jgi:CheY-like chemotaxis protein